MISVVIPVYNEEKRIIENIKEIVTYLEKYEYEVILVDDGSKDRTWQLVKSLHCDNKNIKGVRFSRNFGKEIALCAGLDYANGDAIITMDSDLQHDPKYIDVLIKEWKEGNKLVECVRKSRKKQSLGYKLFANTFYKLLKKLTNLDLANSLDYKIFDRQVIEDIKKLNENNVFFRGLVEWVGYDKKQIEVEIREREGDTSKFSIKSLSKLAITAITSFSSSLLNLVLILGGVFFIGALILGVQTICNKFFGHAVDGFTTVILLLLIIGSCILFSLGIIGMYVARIYNEVKARPRYIVSEEI
ncbi:MAG: glycosyltransferase family 2 protein [Clostridia bacterium]|nr:glycosyltransferase family 2 protein [Clostridia bacterium]